MATEIEPEFVNVRDAAKLFGLAHTTIRRWIRQGRIKAYAPSPRRVLVDRVEIRRYIMERPRQPGTAPTLGVQS